MSPQVIENIKKYLNGVTFQEWRFGKNGGWTDIIKATDRPTFPVSLFGENPLFLREKPVPSYGPQGYPTKEQQDVLPHDRPSRQGQS